MCVSSVYRGDGMHKSTVIGLISILFFMLCRKEISKFREMCNAHNIPWKLLCLANNSLERVNEPYKIKAIPSSCFPAVTRIPPSQAIYLWGLGSALVSLADTYKLWRFSFQSLKELLLTWIFTENCGNFDCYKELSIIFSFRSIWNKRLPNSLVFKLSPWRLEGCLLGYRPEHLRTSVSNLNLLHRPGRFHFAQRKHFKDMAGAFSGNPPDEEVDDIKAWKENLKRIFKVWVFGRES